MSPAADHGVGQSFVREVSSGFGLLKPGPSAQSRTTSAQEVAVVSPAAALDVGAVADLILFPAARGASELLSRPQEDRIVLRGGAVQESTLPKYEDLDDLVSRPTDLSAMASSGGVQRGASKVEAGTVGM